MTSEMNILEFTDEYDVRLKSERKKQFYRFKLSSIIYML